MLTLEDICHGYGLLIGLTSYRLVNGRYQQTRITQAYALIMNVVVICTLPFVFWDIANGVRLGPWLPGKMDIVPFVLYIVDYAVIAYILVSRCQRDSVVKDILDLSDRLTRNMDRAGLRPNPQLRRLLHLKSFTLAYMNISSVATMLFQQSGVLKTLQNSFAYSILNITTYFYFASNWQIARGYDCLNQQLGSGRTSEEEIRNLWSLHLLLGRMAQRINRIYGLQMLVCRLDYIICDIVGGYISIIFQNQGFNFRVVHATSILLARSLDFFINDLICELSQRYQCHPKDEASERIMSQAVR
ncbi:putative gustatory receptor 59b [Drosophila serrata]|uniref:putative gustatory receptor 59b n=1 Tax=Drosophila serrata TaxID=7274 RepID=UPI000A1D3321|nr:putative gustatory receptor 59b [Drosophila serrata]